jgi:hypothetical protein
MVSQINYTSIDATYPIAGKDNDSQGFRDNFGYIKSGLEVAQGEITALQNTAAVTSQNNDFGNNQITGAVFRNNSDLYFDGGTISANTTVTYANGPYQKFVIGGGPLTLSLGFPSTSSQVYKMRIELVGIDTAYAVGFAGTGSTIVTNNISNPFYITSSTNPRIFDVWTTDAGTNIHIYQVNNDDGFYDNGAVSGSDTFSYTSGKYQSYTLEGTTALTVSGFPPAGNTGKIILEINSSVSSSSFTLAALNTAGTAGTIKYSPNFPTAVARANMLMLEIWSHDGGNTVYAKSHGTFS